MITLAKTLEKALWPAVEVETLTTMYMHALAIGEPRHLPPQEMDRMIGQIRRMGYGDAPDLERIADTPWPLDAMSRDHTG